jgi:predicted ATPase
MPGRGHPATAGPTDYRSRAADAGGAHRDNEGTSSRPLTATWAAIRKVGAKMQNILLAPMRLDDIGQLVVDQQETLQNRRIL